MRNRGASKPVRTPGTTLPHLHRDSARPAHICTGTRLVPPPSALGLGSPRHAHTCTGTRLAPAHIWHRRNGLTPATSATGLGSRLPTSAPGLSSPRPHLQRDRAHPAHICTGTGLTSAHICTGTELAPPTSATGQGSPRPHLHGDWAHLCPHLHRDWAHPCPHLQRDRAQPAHICTGTGPGPNAVGSDCRLEFGTLLCQTGELRCHLQRRVPERFRFPMARGGGHTSSCCRMRPVARSTRLICAHPQLA
jgi:hypothetical protein